MSGKQKRVWCMPKTSSFIRDNVSYSNIEEPPYIPFLKINVRVLFCKEWILTQMTSADLTQW